MSDATPSAPPPAGSAGAAPAELVADPELARELAAIWAMLPPEMERERDHGVQTAELLRELDLGDEAVAAGLLVPLRAALADLDPAPALAPGVAELLAATGRLLEIQWEHLAEERAEKLRQMFLVMASDLRAVLVLLASRIPPLRDRERVPAERRRRLAQQCTDVFAPLANRLGVWHLKWQLEDLAFRELLPDMYREIRDFLAQKRTVRTQYVDAVVADLAARLRAAGVDAKVYGRPKHIASIYKKMVRKGVGLDEIYDILAVRVLVGTVPECYAVLGLVHEQWEPIPGEFDDYIARPKGNDYRSLHTAVRGPEDRPLEVQIRTREMHELAEYGVAAHWRYKEGGGRGARAVADKIDWLRRLLEWKDGAGSDDLARALQTDVFRDQVYVFTPGGDVVDLPEGATPIDFAYRIHTQVGHRCRGAKVDGKMVPLDQPLESGQRVEILTGRTSGPSRDWLTPHLGYVKTASARQKIRQYFRSQRREEAAAEGRELVRDALARAGVEDDRLPEVARALGYPGPEELYAAVGFGDVSAQQVASRCLERTPGALPPARARKAPAPPPSRRGGEGVVVAGVEGVLGQPAACCMPVPGDAVVGYVRRGRGLAIHRRDCPNVVHCQEPERLVDVSWGAGAGTRYDVDIRLAVRDRPGILRDITDVLAREGINVTSAHTGPSDGDEGVLDLTVQVGGSDQVLRVLDRLARLPDVHHAARRR